MSHCFCCLEKNQWRPSEKIPGKEKRTQNKYDFVSRVFVIFAFFLVPFFAITSKNRDTKITQFPRKASFVLLWIPPKTCSHPSKFAKFMDSSVLEGARIFSLFCLPNSWCSVLFPCILSYLLQNPQEKVGFFIPFLQSLLAFFRFGLTKSLACRTNDSRLGRRLFDGESVHFLFERGNVERARARVCLDWLGFKVLLFWFPFVFCSASVPSFCSIVVWAILFEFFCLVFIDFPLQVRLVPRKTEKAFQRGCLILYCFCSALLWILSYGFSVSLCVCLKFEIGFNPAQWSPPEPAIPSRRFCVQVYMEICDTPPSSLLILEILLWFRIVNYFILVHITGEWENV